VSSDGVPATTRGFSLKAVLLGGLVNTSCSFAYGVVSQLTVAIVLSARGVKGDAMNAYLFGPAFLIAGLIGGTAATLLGGFVAARIAKARELLNAAASSVPCMVLVLVILLLSKNETPIPTWYTITSYAVIIPAAIFGGHLGLRRKRTLAAAMASWSRLGLPPS
jgi:hypothetical protein